MFVLCCDSEILHLKCLFCFVFCFSFCIHIFWPSKWVVAVSHRLFNQSQRQTEKYICWLVPHQWTVGLQWSVLMFSLVKGNRTTPLTFMTTDPAAPTGTWPWSAFPRTHPSVSVYKGAVTSWGGFFFLILAFGSVRSEGVTCRGAAVKSSPRRRSSALITATAFGLWCSSRQTGRKRTFIFCLCPVQGRRCTFWTGPTRRATRSDTGWPLKRAPPNISEWTPKQEMWLWFRSWTERWGAEEGHNVRLLSLSPVRLKVECDSLLNLTLHFFLLLFFSETEWNISASEHNRRPQQSKLWWCRCHVVISFGVIVIDFSNNKLINSAD